jgi:hypothetical protein
MLVARATLHALGTADGAAELGTSRSEYMQALIVVTGLRPPLASFVSGRLADAWLVQRRRCWLVRAVWRGMRRG